MLINLSGKILKMAKLNELRLRDNFYSPKEIYKDNNEGWPGDWQGRILLALFSHKVIFGQDPKHLKGLLKNIEKYTNSEGYFGEIIDKSNINEQQLAGNSWFLRALRLWYDIDKNEKALQYIQNVLNNLYNNIFDSLNKYPEKYDLSEEGAYGGSLKKTINNWKMSTDIGCLYISLDGITHAYEITKNKKTQVLIEEMIEKFMKTDVVHYRFQTHAVLSALRGITKYYEITGDKKYLEMVKERFDDYINYGMTLNFANYNWFNRQDSWTEPCGIIDSFILAKDLYIHTKEKRYLKLSYQILYNALMFAERENGGFGCDECVSPINPYLKISEGAYDAYWCCSMRGAELLRVLGTFKNNEIITLISGEYLFDEGEIIIESNFPYDNNMKITAKKEILQAVKIHLPLDIKEYKIKGADYSIFENVIELKNIKEYMIVEIVLDIKAEKHEGGKIIDYGVLRLCQYSGISDFKKNIEGIDYNCIPQCYNLSKEEIKKLKIKILF
jgi:hypothetical protein